MEKQLIKKAEKITRDFFKKMTFIVEVTAKEGEADTLLLDIKAEEPQILIGDKGRTLEELQRILGRVLRRAVNDSVYFDLDVNDYKSNKTRYLAELAQDIADEVSLSGREKMLEAMSAMERRIVHTELAKRQDVKTESVGEEPERRVVVKPA